MRTGIRAGPTPQATFPTFRSRAGSLRPRPDRPHQRQERRRTRGTPLSDRRCRQRRDRACWTSAPRHSTSWRVKAPPSDRQHGDDPVLSSDLTDNAGTQIPLARIGGRAGSRRARVGVRHRRVRLQCDGGSCSTRAIAPTTWSRSGNGDRRRRAHALDAGFSRTGGSFSRSHGAGGHFSVTGPAAHRLTRSATAPLRSADRAATASKCSAPRRARCSIRHVRPREDRAVEPGD
jgi:hypothetical protein